MGLLESLLNAEQKIQSRIDRAFGRGAAQTPLEIRREILEDVENHIIRRGGKRTFPFVRIAIHLPTPDASRLEILRAAFEDEDSLGNDIRQLLRESGCECPAKLEIALDFERVINAQGNPEARFHVEYNHIRGQEKVQLQPPSAEFVILKGAAEQPVYRFEKERIQIGRTRELLDKEGRIVRRNDLVFLDNEDDINSTVGRSHATVYYNRDKSEFRIADESSRYGTHIFRDGRPIEVPAGNPRGTGLRSGDEVYLGHASVRFDLAPAKSPE